MQSRNKSSSVTSPESVIAQAQHMFDVPFVQQVQWLAAQQGLTEFESLELLAPRFGMQAMASKGLEQIQLDFEIASFVECRRRGAILGYDKDDVDKLSLVLISATPDQLDSQQWFETVIEGRSPRHLTRVLALEKDFKNILDGAEQTLRAMDSVTIDDTLAGQDLVSSTLVLSIASIEATSNQTVRLVDSTLYDALKLGASDIHFETQKQELHIKYRMDGVLQSIKQIESLDAAQQVISRIKVLSDLDISERRVPQDGRFRVMLEQREVDFRVSIMPNISGEDAVLRILDRKHLTGQFEKLTLDSLKFEQSVKDFIRHASRQPYGLLLVTGPTGSGKTTTLYAAISEINTGLDKIVTIEDPIEYQLAGVLQIPVNEKKGLTFAKGLRSTLRHDPDKIMVGEIRDSETAQIAVQAALTGHQVFTTVHANNVFDVIGRFSNMGVDTYSLVAALSGIMAQRLVRTVCQQCAQATTPNEQDQLTLQEFPQALPTNQITLKRACGCDHCRGTGYKGRAAIAETLHIDDEMKDLLVQHAPISTLKRAARDKGFQSLRESAILLAMRGLTTIEEINRVTPAE